MGFFKKLFDDKRYTVGLLLVWMVAVCVIFYCLGAFHMSYMHIGPGESTVFMGLKIDTWGKWSALAIFSFFNTCINEFISNALDPWFVNSLQDHKTKKIEYSHATCLWIVQIRCMYVHVMGVFALFLFFSQVDFALVRLIADWIVTGYSTVWFIQDKKVVSPGSSRGDGSSVGLYSIDLDERMVHDEECIAGCRDEDCQCHHHHHSHHHTMSCSNSGSSSMLGGANVANNRDAGILCGGCSHVTLYPDMFNKDGRASQTRKGTRGLTNNVSVDSMAAPMSMFSIGNDPEDDKGHSNKSHARRKRDLEDQGDLDKEDEAREEENDSHSQALIKK